MLLKEFLQLRRDRVTFATMISIPLMQLVLFGYAINTMPRDLPTAVLLQENSDVGRTILKALENTRYFKVTRQVRDEAEFDRGAAVRRRCCSASRSRPISSARCGAATARRSWSRPTRTDPVASGSALGALGQLVQTALVNERAIPDSSAAAVRDPRRTPATIRRSRASSTSCPACSAPSSP